jgi:23S rRNA (guanine745-N1)-methyltransferase
VLACPSGHRYDVARQGHVVLVAGGSKLRADTAEMVRARLRVMASGAYDGVRSALVEACGPGVGPGPGAGLVVDLGAGPGTYTAAVLDALPGRHGVALELSVPALRAAARAHPRLAAVGADLARPLPLAGGSVALALAVFAPLPAEEELARTCPPGARLAVVTPTPEHLGRLRDRLGLLDVPAGKPDRLEERLSRGWEPTVAPSAPGGCGSPATSPRTSWPWARTPGTPTTGCGPRSPTCPSTWRTRSQSP